ncbi:MAG: hypothetical protein MSG64_12705 [Pyrinomonadaceae bacterium MAG19_C2-C3]|nr:hypothetical protein [Pyrinomonadaceae bacterium MAG19_C2-C3]
MKNRTVITATENSSSMALLLNSDEAATRARLDFAAATLQKQDARLSKIIERVGRCELDFRKLHNPFNTLVRSIIYQQLNGKAASVIHARTVANLASGRTLKPDDIFAASDEVMRACGLSRAKQLALRDLALRTQDGTVPTLTRLQRMTDEEIIERLTTVRGIGRWTVEMLLMFRLGRPDVLPVGDFAICKAAMLMDGLEAFPKPKELTARGEVWRPFRTVASWYLWRSLDNG